MTPLAARSEMSGPTSLCSSSWSPTTSCGGLLGEDAREVGDHATVHEDALDRAADLAVAARQAAHEDAACGQLQVRVGTDDGGVVAAELGMERLQVLGGDAAQGDAGLDAAGDRDHVHAVGGGEERADAGTLAGQHLVGRRRQAAVLEDARQAQQRQGAVAGRLADDGVAGAERRRHLVRVQLQGVVEGGDGGHDADGLADRHGHVPLRTGHRVHRHLPAEEPLGLLAEAADDARRGVHLLAGLADGLAVLLGQHAGDVLALGHEAIGAGDEDARPFVGWHPRHGAATLLGGRRPRARRPPRSRTGPSR